MKIFQNQIIRFILVGLFNTLHHYIWYLLFLYLIGLSYLISHMVAFVLSLIGSFFLNTYYTYRTKPTLKKFFQFPLTYVVNFTVTTTSVYYFVEIFDWNPNISPLLASLVAIPFTFFISKKILVPKSKS